MGIDELILHIVEELALTSPQHCGTGCGVEPQGFSSSADGFWCQSRWRKIHPPLEGWPLGM